MDDIRKIDAPECDYIGVDRFATAMKEKLAEKACEGRGGWNWPNECSLDHLRQLLKEHAIKGDVVDIANFCMMIWNRKNPHGERRG